MECRASYIASCLTLILSGLVALYSLIAGDPLWTIGYVLALEAISIGIVAARDKRELAYYAAASAIVLAAPLLDIRLLYFAAIVAAYAAAVVAGSRSLSGGLAWLAAPIHSLLAIAGPWVLPLLGGLSLLVASMTVYEYSGKGHSFILASLAPISLAMGPVSLIAGAGAMAVGVFASGLTSERRACPFRRDSLMAMVGSVLALASVLWAWTAGLEAGGFPHVLWVTGILFLEAASLVPLGPSDSRSS